MKHNRRHRRGYVLMVALALTALAAVVSVGLSRAAMRRIVDARQDAEALQLKWGTLSCRQTLLPYAEQLIRHADERADEPVAVLRETVRLGSMRFALAIADEQAKANASSLFVALGESWAEQAVRTLVRGTRLTGNDVAMRGPAGNPWPIGSYADVFREPDPDELSMRSRSSPAAADAITCWGDGRLNVRRAAPDVMVERLAPELSWFQVRGILDARANVRQGRPPAGPVAAVPEGVRSTRFTVQHALTAANVEAGQQQRLRQMMTDRSSCWSLWVTARDERRSWHALWVREILDERNSRITSFEW